MQTEKSSTHLREATSIAWGGGAGLLGRVSSMVLGYCLALVMARGLRLNDYGLYVVGFALVHLAGSVALLGLNRGIVRFIAVYRGRGDQSREWGAFLASVMIVLVTGLIAGTLVMVLAHPLTNLLNAPMQFPDYLWGFACWISLWALTYQIGAVAEAVKRAQDRFFIVDVCGPLFRLLLVSAVLIAGGKLLGVIWACVLAALATLLLLSWRVYHLFVRALGDVSPVFPFRELMTFSIPVMLHNLLNVSRNQVEIYLLAALRSVGASGVFNVASRTSLLVYAFLDGLGVVFSPFIADLAVRQRKTELQELMSTVTRWGLTASLPASLVIITFSGPIVRLFGSDFRDAAPALVILAIAQLISTATGPVETVITMSGRPGLNLVNSLLSIGLSLFLGFILIPRFGIVGAALSGGIATASVNLLRAFQVFWVFGIWCYDRKLLKPVAGAGIAVCVTAVILWLGRPMSDWLAMGMGLPVFLLTYGGSLYVLGLEESDLMVLRSLRARAMQKMSKTH